MWIEIASLLLSPSRYIRRSAAALHHLEPFGARWHVPGTLISSPGIRMRLSTLQISGGYRYAWDCKAIRGLVAVKN
jgi:hypothetical protein